jgi:hypothetical protein
MKQPFPQEALKDNVALFRNMVLAQGVSTPRDLFLKLFAYGT